MITKGKVVIAVGVVLGAATVGAVGFALMGVPLWACENEVVERVPSPDGSREVVVFTRNCGATTDFSTQISILPAGGVLPSRSGNTYIASHQTRVEVTWEGSRVAAIRRAAAGLTEEPEVAGVRVRFLNIEF
jgi:hypothetical protein